MDSIKIEAHDAFFCSDKGLRLSKAHRSGSRVD